MAAGATKVDIATQSIQGHINTLRSEVETMFGGWRGDAANSFSQVHNSFEVQAKKINDALRSMHEALVATHRVYGTQEADQSQGFNSMVGQING
jgi:WXG100 family type VII secretion target